MIRARAASSHDASQSSSLHDSSPSDERPPRMAADLRHWFRRWYVAGVAALALVALVTVLLAVWLTTAAGWVARSSRVLGVAHVARTLAVDRETGVRGYLLTGDVAFLEPELAARDRLRVALDSLVALTADNPAQQAAAHSIALSLDRWSHDVIGPGPIPDRSPVPTAADLAHGKRLFDTVRADFATFLASEEQLYGQQARDAARARWVSITTALAGLALLGVVLRGFRVELRRQGNVMREQQARLEEQAVELEYQLEQLQQQAMELEVSNVELERSNAHLAETLSAAELSEERATQAREEWRLVGRRLAFVLESSPIALAIVDAHRHVELANPAFTGLAGGPSEVIGQSIADSLPTYATVIDPLIERVFAGGTAAVDVELTTPGVKVTGGPSTKPAPRLWSASVYPIPTDGRVVGAGVVLLEMTERRQLEDQFRQAQRMEAVGRLTGGIAHDFNNILTAITGFGELVAAKLEPGTTIADDVQQVLLAAERATTLTRQLLAFSRQQVLQPEVLDLNEVVVELEPLLRRLLGADVAFDTRLAPHLARVLADPGQIEQILMNLTVNARDAMPDGGQLLVETRDVTLDGSYIRRHPGAVAGPHVLLAVSDTGIGMDEETVARVFEPFFTTKPAGKGTGLGLSTVYGIVKQSGGGIEIYSEPGHGTTFRVYLPRHHGAVGNPTPSRSMPAVQEDRPATILLVEDDATVASVARRVLEGHGYRVIGATDGHAALAAARNRTSSIDLVITDLVMPEMGGRALAERLTEEWPDVQVLFMSGYTAEAVNQRAVLPPDAAFLEKPFRPNDLLDQVRRLLAGTRDPELGTR